MKGNKTEPIEPWGFSSSRNYPQPHCVPTMSRVDG